MSMGAHPRVRGRAIFGLVAVCLALAVGTMAAANPSASDRPTVAGAPAQASRSGEPQAITGPVAETGVATSADAAVALAATNLTYNTVDPCRVFDSRNFGGPIPPGAGYRIVIASLCGIPFDGTVKAVMVNAIAVNTTGTGYVRAAAYPIEENFQATILNFNNGLVSSNGIAVPICDSSVQACDFDLDFIVNTGSSHIVFDVMGYFSTTAPS